MSTLSEKWLILAILVNSHILNITGMKGSVCYMLWSYKQVSLCHPVIFDTCISGNISVTSVEVYVITNCTSVTMCGAGVGCCSHGNVTPTSDPESIIWECTSTMCLRGLRVYDFPITGQASNIIEFTFNCVDNSSTNAPSSAITPTTMRNDSTVTSSVLQTYTTVIKTTTDTLSTAYELSTKTMDGSSITASSSAITLTTIRYVSTVSSTVLQALTTVTKTSTDTLSTAFGLTSKTTSPPVSTSLSTVKIEDSEDLSIGVYVGLPVVLIVFSIVLAAILFIWRRKHQSVSKQTSEAIQNQPSISAIPSEQILSGTELVLQNSTVPTSTIDLGDYDEICDGQLIRGESRVKSAAVEYVNVTDDVTINYENTSQNARHVYNDLSRHGTVEEHSYQPLRFSTK